MSTARFILSLRVIVSACSLPLIRHWISYVIPLHRIADLLRLLQVSSKWWRSVMGVWKGSCCRYGSRSETWKTGWTFTWKGASWLSCSLSWYLRAVFTTGVPILSQYMESTRYIGRFSPLVSRFSHRKSIFPLRGSGLNPPIQGFQTISGSFLSVRRLVHSAKFHNSRAPMRAINSLECSAPACGYGWSPWVSSVLPNLPKLVLINVFLHFATAFKSSHLRSWRRSLTS